MRLVGKLLNTEGVYEIEISEGLIKSVTPVGLEASPKVESLILPGLIDIQVNGYGGFDFNGNNLDASTVANCVRSLWNCGVTALCPTLITNSHEALLRSIHAIREACETDELINNAILGIHLEGPYVSHKDGPRGSHEVQYTRDPDWSEFEEYQEAAGGRIRMVTLAPERPGALNFIEQLRDEGVIVAIGHTSARPEMIDLAARRGVSLVTHIGNGVHPYLHRHDSYVWEELVQDELSASVICDGIHLPNRLIRTILRCKGVGKTILISDSLAMAGLPPGVYPGTANGVLEVKPDGRIIRMDSGILAGSSWNVVQCVRYAASFAETGLSAAVEMATINPSRLLGMDRLLGSISVGKTANLTIVRDQPLEDDMTVLQTIVNGKVVYCQQEYAL